MLKLEGSRAGVTCVEGQPYFPIHFQAIFDAG
jgi:hypothetical protein